MILLSTVETLLKDTPNKGHNTFDLSVKTKSVVPTVSWQYNLTSQREQPLYNSTSKIMPKIAGPKVSIIQRFYCIYKGDCQNLF